MFKSKTMLTFTFSGKASMRTEGERQTGVVKTRVSLYFELAFFNYFWACLSKAISQQLDKE